jgi:hypothetical protein
MEAINVMDYGVVVSKKKLKETGAEVGNYLSPGDLVLVAAKEFVPFSAADPYLQRMYVSVIKVVDGEHQLPNEKNDYLVFKIDPRSLEKVTDEETISNLHKQLGP